MQFCHTARYEPMNATQFYDSKKSISDNTVQQKKTSQTHQTSCFEVQKKKISTAQDIKM
jgi:hypothetical protein